MINSKIVGAAVLIFVSVAAGQQTFSSRIRGLRVYGATEASLPVASPAGQPVTIEFDVVDPQAPDLQLTFFHCDKDWNVTENVFVNDLQRNMTRAELPFVAAPANVQGYTFHYTIKVPDPVLYERFPYSGNYVFELRERGKDQILARGRFFVVENMVRPTMSVANRQEPSLPSPYYQMNRISVRFTVPEPDSTERMVMMGPLFSTVDVYRNKEVYRPHRIDTDDMDPHTFVNGLATRRLEFIIDNVEPGNNYRVLDLRNIDFYPQDRMLRSHTGADASRFLGKPGPGVGGGSSIVREGRYAEYLDYTFELLWPAAEQSPVYVVGDFNGWRPSAENTMTFERDRYVWKTSLRRGVYDYQYVCGDDWVVFEGNQWSVSSVYTAFVYYHDQRFGGFDRIAGIARGRGPGGTRATSD